MSSQPYSDDCCLCVVPVSSGQSPCLFLLGAGPRHHLPCGYVEIALALGGPASLLLPGQGWSHQEKSRTGRLQPMSLVLLDWRVLGRQSVVYCPIATGLLEDGLAVQSVPRVEVSGVAEVLPLLSLEFRLQNLSIHTLKKFTQESVCSFKCLCDHTPAPKRHHECPQEACGQERLVALSWVHSPSLFSPLPPEGSMWWGDGVLGRGVDCLPLDQVEPCRTELTQHTACAVSRPSRPLTAQPKELELDSCCVCVGLVHSGIFSPSFLAFERRWIHEIPLSLQVSR